MDPHDLPTPLPPEVLPTRPDGTRPRPEVLHASHRRTGASFPVSPYAPLAHGMLLAGATASVFLAGKPQQGALGILLVFAGLAMVVCPPRVKVAWRLWLAAAATVGGAALALLPERWFPQPAWRKTLDTLPSLVMPDTISTTPALTAFWLAVLALALLSGLFLLAHPIRSRWMLTFALFAAVAAGVYGALAIYAKETGWHYPFSAGATFGFLPNRNHTATLLFVGSLLALGVLGVVLRESRWFLGTVAGAALCVCALGLGVFSPSRGGIVFLVVGVVAWVAGLGRRHRDVRLTISFAAVLLASGLLFLASGGQVRDRLLGLHAPPPPRSATADAGPGPLAPPDEVDPMHNLSTDFRLKIYRDAADAVHDFPLTGMGLGTFAQVFPQYRRASLSESLAIHPESDWLMLAAEAGIPAALCLLALIVLAAGQLASQRDHPYWPLRWGCAVAAGAAALHGLVDVPIHRVQLGWWVMVIAGLALQDARTGPGGRSRAQQILFITGGVLALGLGSALIRAQWFRGLPLPPFRDSQAQEEVVAAFNRKDPEGAVNTARAALSLSPMNAPLYYQLGVLLLYFEDTEADVDRAFRAQRVLNPVWPAIPLLQGDAWVATDSDRATSLWLEALERQRRIDQAQGTPPGITLGFYRDLLGRAKRYPAVRQTLGRIATRSPAYALAWLEGVNDAIAPADWDRLTSSPEFLRSFSEGERQRLLVIWNAKGDPDALARFVDDHPDWRAAAWPVHLQQLVDKRQFEAAVHEAAARYQVSLDLPTDTVNDDGAPAPAAPPPEHDVLAAFAQYWREGNTIAARRVLAEAAQAPENSPLPAEYWRVRAALAAQDHAWDAAWEFLRRCLQQAHPSDVIP